MVDADVSPVEQGVDIRSQENAIVDSMFTTLRNRKNVRGLKCRKDLVARYGAATPVSLLDDGLKSCLT